MKINPIVKMELSELVPHHQNPRKITKEKLEMLKKSLEQFGDTQIMTWNKRTGRLLSGHQRLKVMLAAGLKEADVRVVDVPENEEKAILLNSNVGYGEFIMPQLTDMLLELDASEDFDLELTGFSLEDVEKLSLNAPPEEKKSKEKVCPNCGYSLKKE